MLNLLRLLLIAGNETTSNLIGNGVLAWRFLMAPGPWLANLPLRCLGGLTGLRLRHVIPASAACATASSSSLDARSSSRRRSARWRKTSSRWRWNRAIGPGRRSLLAKSSRPGKSGLDIHSLHRRPHRPPPRGP